MVVKRIQLGTEILMFLAVFGISVPLSKNIADYLTLVAIGCLVVLLFHGLWEIVIGFVQMIAKPTGSKRQGGNMSSRSGFYDDGRVGSQRGLLAQIFLGEHSWVVSALSVLAITGALAVHDLNPNPAIAIVGLFVFWLTWYGVVVSFWNWLTTTEAQRKEKEERERQERHRSKDKEPVLATWWDWLGFPGQFLLAGLVGLFVLGPLGNSGYYLLSSPFGTRTIQANGVSFHVPLYESVSRWDINHTVTSTAVTAVTADGKRITADVQVALAMDDNPDTVGLLQSKFGNPVNYQQKLQAAVLSEFAKATGQYRLDFFPNTLVLEDYVGTKVGLEGLRTTWSGAVVISNIHRFADAGK